MVLEEIINKLEAEKPADQKLNKNSESSFFSMPNWISNGGKPWMGYGISFIVFGVLLIAAFKYLLAFGF